jgi:preprotein translocase subunit SecE
MRKIFTFFQESFAELRKVTWPSREETVASTKVVIISTLIIAAMLGIVDLVLFQIMARLF